MSKALKMRKIGNIGNINPIKYGGGIIFTSSKQDEPWLEYFDGLSDLGFDEDPKELSELDITVYRVGLEKNAKTFLNQYNWADWKRIARLTGSNIKDYTTLSRLKTIRNRALATQNIADYYGWDEIDQDPLLITIGKLINRWA